MEDSKRDLIIENIKTEVEQIPKIELAILFGSIVTENFKPSSDIDLAVKCKNPLSIDEKVEISSNLSEKTGRELDLVDLDAAHGALLQEAIVRGKVIYKSHPSVFEALLKRMLAEKEDDARFHEKTVAERKRIWLHRTKP